MGHLTKALGVAGDYAAEREYELQETWGSVVGALGDTAHNAGDGKVYLDVTQRQHVSLLRLMATVLPAMWQDIRGTVYRAAGPEFRSRRAADEWLAKRDRGIAALVAACESRAKGEPRGHVRPRPAGAEINGSGYRSGFVLWLDEVRAADGAVVAADLLASAEFAHKLVDPHELGQVFLGRGGSAFDIESLPAPLVDLIRRVLGSHA